MALALVFMAEMGDKTQLVAIAFAAIYPARVVIAGIFLATLVVHLFWQAVGAALPLLWIKVAAGLSFIGFAIWTIRGDEVDEKESLCGGRLGPLLAVAITFFLAELGDKTMLATIAIASRWNNFLGVWLGSTVGMVGADALAVFGGRLMGQRIPDKLIKYSAACVFALSGMFTLVEALIHRA